MSREGFLAAFWADVGYVKLMSNFHSPEQGQVLRRVSGQADKEERGAPTVGVEYNNFMGGTDLRLGRLRARLVHYPPPRQEVVALSVLLVSGHGNVQCFCVVQVVLVI